MSWNWYLNCVWRPKREWKRYRDTLGRPDLETWVSDSDATFAGCYSPRAAAWFPSRVRLISDIGEKCKGPNVFLKVSIHSVISKYVCAILHDPNTPPECGTCSVSTASRQRNWRKSNALKQRKLTATNEVLDTLHLQWHAAQCLCVQVAVKDCKLPEDTKYLTVCPESCVKPYFVD